MKATYDDKLLRSYLLGGLSEADTETCDDLSFTDDNFVARLQAIEDDLIDSYLQNELPDSERAQFQSYYLASPRRQEKVNFARSLQSFVAQQATQTITPPIENAKTEQTPQTTEATSWWQSLRNLFTLPNLTMQWGMAAAALLLLLAGGWLFTEVQRLRGQIDATQTERAALQKREQELQSQIETQRRTTSANIEELNAELKRTQQQLEQLKQQQELAQRQKQQLAQTQPPVSAPGLLYIELTPQTRGVGKTTELAIPERVGSAVLQLVAPEDDFQIYQAEIVTQEDEKLRWKGGKLKARTRGTNRIIDVNVRAALLSPGNYVVKLNGVAANGQIEELRKYSFRVVKP